MLYIYVNLCPSHLTSSLHVTFIFLPYLFTSGKIHVSKTIQPPGDMVEVACLQQLQGWDLLSLRSHVKNHNIKNESDLGEDPILWNTFQPPHPNHAEVSTQRYYISNHRHLSPPPSFPPTLISNSLPDLIVP